MSEIANLRQPRCERQQDMKEKYFELFSTFFKKAPCSWFD
jgi:hypothetical protein